MTAQTYLDQRNNQQRSISSLRRKDRLWIYKNPQGLLILEDELNERKKKRFARQRTSPPIKDVENSNTINNKELLSIAPLNMIDSSIPDDAILPIAKKNITQENEDKSTASNTVLEAQPKNHNIENTDRKQNQISSNNKNTSENQSIQKQDVKSKVRQLSQDKFLQQQQQQQQQQQAPVESSVEVKPPKRNLISEISKAFLQGEQNPPTLEIMPKLSVSTSPKKEIIPKTYLSTSTQSERASQKPSESAPPKKGIIPKAFAPIPQKLEVVAPRSSVSTMTPPKKDIIPKAFLVESSRSEVLLKTSARKKEVTVPKAFLSQKSDVEFKASPLLKKVSPDSVVPAPQKKQIIPRKSPISTPPPPNFLAEAKKSLSSVQHKTIESKTATSPIEVPTKKQGLVSSFVTALESPPLQEQKVTDEKLLKNKRNTLRSLPPQASKELQELPKQVETNTILNPVNPIKPQSPPPLLRSSSKTDISTSNEVQASLDKQPTSTITTHFNISSRSASPNSDSVINVYLPRLSPDISFNNDQDHQLSIPEQANDDMDGYSRPVIKKRVSFSDQLLTYIPEHSDDDEVSSPSSNNKQQQQQQQQSHFTEALQQGLSETKKKLVEERKVNTTPSRESFIPAVVKKLDNNSPTSSISSAPQKLSNKLLDMFQQKLLQSPKPKQEPAVSSSSQPLVHLTKTRPRKPPSLKKPTYPAATAQPNWRNRATNKKYEFVA